MLSKIMSALVLIFLPMSCVASFINDILGVPSAAVGVGTQITTTSTCESLAKSLVASNRLLFMIRCKFSLGKSAI
ncbi:hypothetical protein D3C79_1028140 [compost metagenome]